MRQNTFVCKQEHEKRNYCYRNVIVFKCISAFIGASFGCGDKSTFRNEHVTWKILMVKFAARQKVKHTEVIRYGIQYTIVNVCIAHATVSLERRSPLCVRVCVFLHDICRSIQINSALSLKRIFYESGLQRLKFRKCAQERCRAA